MIANLNQQTNYLRTIRQETCQSSPEFYDSIISCQNSKFTIDQNNSKDQNLQFQTSFGDNILTNVDLKTNCIEINRNDKQNLGESRNINHNFKKQIQVTRQKSINSIGNIINSFTFIPNINVKLLQPLKSSFKGEKINSDIRKKKFDFDIKFYEQAINLVSSLGYKQHPDYCYLSDQLRICQQIYKISETYTFPDSQQEQNELKQNIQRCKKLFNKLDTKKTFRVVKKYLEMQGESLSYKIGHLGLQVNLPKQLIQRHLQNPKFNQIITLLYLMEYFGNNQKFKTIVKETIKFADYGLEYIKNLEGQQNQTLKRQLQIAKRILTIGLYSLIQDQYQRKIASTFKKLIIFFKDCKSQSELVPSYYLTFMSEYACRDQHNLYIFKQKIQEFINDYPVCSLCIRPIDICGLENSGVKRPDGHFHHFQCENFIQQICNCQEQEQKN